MHTMFCPSCKQKIDPSEIVCPNCQADQRPPALRPKQPTPTPVSQDPTIQMAVPSPPTVNIAPSDPTVQMVTSATPSVAVVQPIQQRRSPVWPIMVVIFLLFGALSVGLFTLPKHPKPSPVVGSWQLNAKIEKNYDYDISTVVHAMSSTVEESRSLKVYDNGICNLTSTALLSYVNLDGETISGLGFWYYLDHNHKDFTGRGTIADPVISHKMLMWSSDSSPDGRYLILTDNATGKIERFKWSVTDDGKMLTLTKDGGQPEIYVRVPSSPGDTTN